MKPIKSKDQRLIAADEAGRRLAAYVQDPVIEKHFATQAEHVIAMICDQALTASDISLRAYAIQLRTLREFASTGRAVVHEGERATRELYKGTA
jgi:hypothetical protein